MKAYSDLGVHRPTTLECRAFTLNDVSHTANVSRE